MWWPAASTNARPTIAVVRAWLCARVRVYHAEQIRVSCSFKKDYPDQAQDLARFTGGTPTPAAFPRVDAASTGDTDSETPIHELQRLAATVSRQAAENEFLKVSCGCVLLCLACVCSRCCLLRRRN